MRNAQLGSEPEDKLLIIHIDDIGMCHSANVASLDALRNGAATSGTVMIPCPWTLEVAEAAADTPDLDLGVHSTFTSEWERYKWGPVAGRGEVPSLTEVTGYFPRWVPEVAEKAEAADFERELRAQIDQALLIGLKPTHLDTHMATCYGRGDFFEIYLRVGKEYGIPPMVVRPPKKDIEGLPKVLAAWAEFISPERLEDEGHVLIDHVCMPVRADGTLEAKRSAYHDEIRCCVPGVNLLITHMATEGEEASAIMGAERARRRFEDYKVFTEQETLRVVEQSGVKLIGWRPLQQAFVG